MRRHTIVLCLCGLLGLTAAGAPAAEPDVTPEQRQFFENKVRPLLAERCFKCHGPEKQRGGLRLDSLAGLLTGGETGAALAPGKPDESLLIEAIQYKSIEMPPDGQLKPDEIAVLTDWVRQGAVWPGADPQAPLTPRKGGLEVTDADRQFWSFQPLQAPVAPQVERADLVRNPIDAFILDRLAKAGIAPAPQATKRELIRRVAFDLLGLPPTPEEVAAFLADESPEAYERIVDQYLARPQFGERWGRHWLDIVRFAQTNGYERDDEKPHSWRYRDYVIRSFNDDKPYDQFVREQLAGDELDQVTDDTLTATAFYRLGVWDDEPDDKQQADFDELDDMLSTTTSAFLGLTVGCARCHDHKFDPIPQRDYYSLLAFLRNIKPYAKPDKDADKTIFINLTDGGKSLGIHEPGPQSPPTHILIRGAAATPGAEVVPAFPEVLCTTREAAIPALPARDTAATTAGRRRILADWIASTRQPLTARVIANRIWQHHFGRGIVPTPNDFGQTGLPPSHPELLDYLATSLVDGGWRMKSLHKQIVMSGTYQQSSRIENESGVLQDPDNTLLWRQNLRRLEAEAIRDAMLAVNGKLNLEQGGRGFFPALSAEVLSTQSRPGNGWDKSTPEQQARRSVYIFVKRTLGVPLMESFDMASPDTSAAARNTTTIAPQALMLLNSSFVDEQAAAFAERLLLAGGTEEDQIRNAFRIAIARAPTPYELETLQEYLHRQQTAWKENPPPTPMPAEKTDQQLAGWSYFGGAWSLREDGGHQVEPHPGGKTVWNEPVFADGIVECQVLLAAEEGDAGVLLRVNDPANGTDTLKAYNINFARGAFRLGKHVNNWQALATAPHDLALNEWHQLKIQAEGGRIRVWVDGAENPLLDVTDPEPLAAGKLGFRTFQTKAAFRNLKATAGEKTWTADLRPPMPTSSETEGDQVTRRALTSLCKIVLNLNEFVYID